MCGRPFKVVLGAELLFAVHLLVLVDFFGRLVTVGNVLVVDLEWMSEVRNQLVVRLRLYASLLKKRLVFEGGHAFEVN